VTRTHGPAGTGLIYNYISMVESLPSIMVFSQVIDDVLPPESAEKSFVHETISRCDTRGGPVTPVANTPMNRSLQYNSPKSTKRSTEHLPASASRGVQAKHPRTPSILDEVRETFLGGWFNNTQSAGPIIGVHEAPWCVCRKHVAKECLGQKIPAYLPT
jgi:hypothetical protein